jgi:hypothetical protein
MKKESKKMEVKDREIWIGENRLYLDEDNIFNVVIVGEIDAKTANAMKYAGLRLNNMFRGKAKALIDLNKAGKHSSEARKIWKESSELEIADKIAYFGLHPVARVLASFVMGVSKKKDMRFFKTKEEALAWLKV